MLSLNYNDTSDSCQSSVSMQINLRTELELDVSLRIGNCRRSHEEAKKMKERSPVQLNLLPFRPLARQATAECDIVPDLQLISRQLLYHGSQRELFLGMDVNPRSPVTETSRNRNVAFANNSITPFSQLDAPRNGGNLFKRKREAVMLEFDGEHDRVFETNSSRAGSDEEEGGNLRKKLRLSKVQSAFLEESFKEHSTLNPKQKNSLAKQLNLTPRQVEVWFQNRRARTKLKQTEVDCELLKRYCENLTEENIRLQKELKDLQALKLVSSPFLISHDFRRPLPATTLTLCPSCERLSEVAKTSNRPFPKRFRQHAQSSAAC